MQVQSVGGDGGASGLDLAPEVFGFVDKEAIGVGEIGEDVLLEPEDFVLLAVFVGIGPPGVFEVFGGRVGDHSRTLGSAFDGCADRGKDGFGGEEVDTAIDEVGDLGFGLLDVMQDAVGVGVGDNAAEVGGSLIGHAGTKNDGFSVFLFEEVEHGFKGKGAADIRIEYEEPLRLAFEDSISEVV